MLELLAAIQGMDPTAALLWSLLAFAASMYPLGIMLGSPCSPCCGPCPCPTGTLPDTLTVTFKGLPDQTRGSDLLGLSFESCFGSGAAGRILEPGGVAGVDDGPIESVSLTKAGSGYAKYGRVEPTLTATGSGTGAEFSITLSKAQDACSVDYWKLSSIAVTKGGTGYDDGESLTITVAEGDTEEVPASATVSTTRSAPTLTVTAPPGVGGVFTVTTEESGSAWTISSVSVTSGGSGYVDLTQMTVGLGANDVEESQAYLYVRTGRTEPTVSLSVSSTNGIGSVLTPTLTKATGYDGRDVWNISAITITQAGNGYEVNDFISATVQDGQESYYSYFYAYVSEVGGSGEITAIDLQYQGEYFKDNGVAEAVEISNGGSYYNDNGIITKVTVGNQGAYWREDKSEPPYVAPVTVTINQNYPSNGSGGEITATVDSDTGSATFGQISGLDIAEAGDDYLAWEWKNTKCCGWYWDDKSVVVRRATLAYEYPCELTFASCFGSGASGKVTAPGQTIWSPPGPIESVSLTGGGSGYAQLGRVAPTITPTVTPGSGAAFTVKLTESKDACGLSEWNIASVAVDKPGVGYKNGATITFPGNAIVTGSGTIAIATSQPTLTATPSGSGSGAALAVNVTPLGTTPETWKIGSISVTNGGAGYIDNKSVTITPAGTSATVTAASAAIRTSRLEPTLAASLFSEAGTGAELLPVLSSFANTDGRTVWGVSGFTINKGGQDYKISDGIGITVSDGQQADFLYYASVSGVDPNGSITSTKVSNQGKFFKDGGVIELVTLSSSGAYYQDDGIASVSVTNKGLYYKQDASIAPYVAAVTVGFEASCQGTGAEIAPTIDTDTGSKTFGQITGLTVTKSGDGYFAGVGYSANAPVGVDPATGFESGGVSDDDREAQCYYSHRMCGGWQGRTRPGAVVVHYRGPALPPRVLLYTEVWPKESSDEPAGSTRCNGTFIADKSLASCDSWGGLLFSNTLENGDPADGTATVVQGGVYNETYKRNATRDGSPANLVTAGLCDECCQGEEDPPQEITVTLDHNRYGETSLSGDYVLQRFTNGSLNWAYISPTAPSLAITVGINPGRCDDASVKACDNCIKKCEATASIFWQPSWPPIVDSDMRECSSNEPGLTEQEKAIALCDAFCTEDTPICTPSGMVFDFFHPQGSENWYDPTKSICGENTDLESYPNHLNTFKITVQ